VILLQTVAKWHCIKLCAIFSGPPCTWQQRPLYEISQLTNRSDAGT